MDFTQVIHALKTIKKHCQETPNCERCSLHVGKQPVRCGVSPDGVLPCRWEFDFESEETVPSIFK